MTKNRSNTSFVKCLILVVALGLFIWQMEGKFQSEELEGAFFPPDEMHHDQLEVDPNQPIPSIEILVEEDLNSGYNLTILTENFTFTPEKAQLTDDQSPNEGHAHLHINGKKITRLYNVYSYLPSYWFVEGENAISVSLNANDHSDWTLNGDSIGDQVSITVFTGEEMDMSETES